MINVLESSIGVLVHEFLGKESVSITPTVPLCVWNQRSKKYLLGTEASHRLGVVILPSW